MFNPFLLFDGKQLLVPHLDHLRSELLASWSKLQDLWMLGHGKRLSPAEDRPRGHLQR